MSFQQGLSGLNATSKSLEIIGNNIANSGTFGAKSSRADARDEAKAPKAAAAAEPKSETDDRDAATAADDAKQAEPKRDSSAAGGEGTPLEDTHPPDNRWRADDQACRRQAQTTLSSPYGVYAGCMREKGWPAVKP